MPSPPSSRSFLICSSSNRYLRPISSASVFSFSSRRCISSRRLTASVLNDSTSLFSESRRTTYSRSAFCVRAVLSVREASISRIVFFDVETTTPARAGRKFWLLEFGAILVCPRKLAEVDSYCTLIRPGDLSMVSPKRFSGITREAVAAAPMFEEVADRIFEILNGTYINFSRAIVTG